MIQFDNDQFALDFCQVFRCRLDVYAEYWESSKGKGFSPACANKWSPNICALSRENNLTGGCKKCAHTSHVPLSHNVIKGHLLGQTTRIGIYPLLAEAPDLSGKVISNAAFWIAIDFDDHSGTKNPHKDVQTFVQICLLYGIPVHVEISNSGAGYHVWVFFLQATPARLARHAVYALLEKAGLVGAEENNSLDRSFPNQDELSGKKLGNLIAAPLYGPNMQLNRTAFIDPYNWKLFDQRFQWSYISQIADHIRQGIVGQFVTDIPALQHVLDELGEPETLKTKAKKERTKRGGTSTTAPISSCQIVLDRCVFMKHCEANAATIPEPLWRDMISNLCRFPDGSVNIHRLSALDAVRYDQQSTDSKIEHLAASSGPITCETIRADGFFGCPSGGCCVNAPAALGWTTNTPPQSFLIQTDKNRIDYLAVAEAFLQEKGFIQ